GGRRAGQRLERHSPRRVSGQRALRVPAGALSWPGERNGRAASDRPARADDRGPPRRSGKGFRGGSRRGLLEATRRDPLVSDGGGRHRSALCLSALAAQPLGDSRGTERTGAAERGQRFDREDDRRDPDPATRDELWPPGGSPVRAIQRNGARMALRGITMKVRTAVLALAAFAWTHLALAAPPSQADLEHARRLLAQAILFDGHNDLPWAIRTDKKAPGDVDAYDLRRRTAGQTDLPRLRQGGVSAQFWSVYIPGELTTGFARTQLEQIDLMRRVIARYPEALRPASTARDIREAKKAGRIGSMLGVEGGHAIENSLGALRAYYDLGVRYMTLTHNTNTDW